MIRSAVRRGVDEYDAKFAWVLEVSGIPVACDEIRWEQFVSGGFTLHFSDNSLRVYSAVILMQRVNPQARRFGAWSDDLLAGMSPGPRAIGSYQYASCPNGVTRPLANAPATMRGPSADVRGTTYRFEDAPGFEKNIGDVVNGKTFVAIGWQTQFEHKLWRHGESQPFHQERFTLTGRYDGVGPDSRRII